MGWLPASSLGRVFLFFPDPWPKRRQRKRRFASEENLAVLARAMRSGAELRFVTDIDDYSGWTLARILRSPDFLWPAEQSVDWARPWEGWRETRYEAKARQARRQPVYLTFLAYGGSSALGALSGTNHKVDAFAPGVSASSSGAPPSIG
jgi:tRNA (guanine-N7-)-methyltransferase